MCRKLAWCPAAMRTMMVSLVRMTRMFRLNDLWHPFSFVPCLCRRTNPCLRLSFRFGFTCVPACAPPWVLKGVEKEGR